ncbi:MAG: peptide deformylase [Clostridia bacterium]
MTRHSGISRPVTNFDDRLHILLDDMRETLVEADGVGLAAPQVGVLRRAVIVLIGEDYVELINPEIIGRSGEQTGPEGCLSVPGVSGTVTRPNYVKVRAQDRNGCFFEIGGEALCARAFCHETDHLDGKLFTDFVTEYID